MQESKASQLLNQLQTNNTLEAILLKSLLTEVVTSENNLLLDIKKLNDDRKSFEAWTQDSRNVGDCLDNLIELLGKMGSNWLPINNNRFSIGSQHNMLTDRIEYHIKLL